MRNLIFLFFIAAVALNAKEYKRVVSLSPAVTEMICVLGRQDKLVGRSSACDYPVEIKKVPVAGELGIPAIETVIKLKADLIITDITTPQTDWNLLKKAGVKVIVLKSEKISDYRDNITTIGKMLGVEENAEKECRRFYDDLKSASAEYSDLKVKTLLLLGMDPLVSCNKNSFADEILFKSGAVSITRNFPKTYFVLSPEYVIQQNPRIVILTGMSGDFRKYLQSIKAWQALDFIRNNSIIDNIPQELICRLSPRTPLAVKIIGREIRNTLKRH